MITKEEFKSRRTKVLDYLKETGGRAVFKSGQLKNFSNDVHYPFRVDSNFYYLTGFTEPNAICVLDPQADNPYSLYVEPYDPKHELWDGYREGLEGAKENFNADASYDIHDYKEIQDAKELEELVHSMRSIKSKAETEVMRKSAAIAVQAHRVAAELITPGIYEYEVEAALYQVFRSQGASGCAYPAIVASGINACTLHYIENKKKIDKNDLILIDAGCEYQYYASDITRVHHASGKMSQAQQDIYDLVIAAQQAAIATIKPGASFQESHDAACNVIAEGLVDLGYMKDKNDPEELKQFYMHGTGHSLGMDVHDVGVDKKTTKYVVGMVTTVEPGIYIKSKKIGVRIEDDVVVTPKGSECLTEGLEK
ncbi:MAG: aminopeptidase P N-terminal domain-containing protein [Candidatus Melainabacteria bacterium]|nr:aminopeptidase P N-terminal domain-containing protein [Candidatus Melainabacteria bacterium]